MFAQRPDCRPAVLFWMLLTLFVCILSLATSTCQAAELVAAGWCTVQDGATGWCDVGVGLALVSTRIESIERDLALVGTLGEKSVGIGVALIMAPQVAVGVGVAAPYDLKTGVDAREWAWTVGVNLRRKKD